MILKTLERTGEKKLQDEFQRQIETGLGGKQHVLLWNKNHELLRHDDHTGQSRSLVLMQDLVTTSDKSFGVERNNITVNIKGLVSSLHEVNKETFDAWLEKYPEVTLTSLDLAQLCASHVADLFEQHDFADNTKLWQLLLAFGEKHIWDQAVEIFHIKHDPRYLTASLIAGAPNHADNLHYTVCWTSQHNTDAFLDLIPQWLNEEMGDLSVACQTYAHNIFQHAKRNNHCHVREYPIGGLTKEYPDFVTFINGLPIVYTEMKTPAAGIDQAIKDFQNKPHYQRAPLCLASSGSKIIFTHKVDGKLEAWVNYNTNMSDTNYWNAPHDPLHSQQYFLEQILSKPKRLEFLITRCCSLNGSTFKVARAQQYQALSRFEQDLEWTTIANTILQQHNTGVDALSRLMPMQKHRQRHNTKTSLTFGNRLIRHTQRTGKTHTMVRAIHLALDGHPDLFRLSLLMVGEVQILSQIANEINTNMSFGDNNLVVERAESRQGLQQTLVREAQFQTHTDGKVLLANMQKISPSDIASLSIPDSHKTLVVLDEGHLAQTGSTSDIRDMIFPNATHLLLTATPKNAMAIHYGISKPWHVLDDFGFGMARTANIVCPIVFKRVAPKFKDNAQDLGRLADALKETLHAQFPNADTNAIELALQQVLDDSDDNISEGKMARQLAQAVRRQVEHELIQERLDVIVSELNTYEQGLEQKPDGTRIFSPRGLFFDRDTNSAISIIQFIQEQNRNNGLTDNKQLNCYKGWRFGIDVSNFGKDPNGNDNRTFQSLNPGVADQKDIEARLVNMDSDMRIDVLLAVGKYTKGYDNDQLAIAGVLRSVGEPSLMNQMFTRPATKRMGKAKGVFLDLSLGNDNVTCFKESLALYDKKVDLNNLLQQENIDQLVENVKNGLTKAAATLNITLETLAKPVEVIRVLEAMDDKVKKDKARQFVLVSRNVTGEINNMPDSSIFGTLRAPLIGMRQTLRNLQTMYPDLVEDTSVSVDGTVDAGHTPQQLGDIIRQALQVLGQSSLKSLLEITLSERDIFEISTDSSPEAVLAVEHVKTKNTRTKTISALEAVVGEDTPKRKKKTTTVLLDALNRVLDRLRDDAYTIEQQRKNIDEAHHVLQQWMAHENTQTQGLEYFVHDILEQALLSKAHALNADIDHVGLDDNGVLHDLVRVASSDMVNHFNQWFQGLSAEWVEQEPSVLAHAWRQQYRRTSLADFLSDTSRQFAVHGLTPEQWIQKIAALSTQSISLLLNETGVDLSDRVSLIGYVMCKALEKRQAILEAQAWQKNLSDGRMVDVA